MSRRPRLRRAALAPLLCAAVLLTALAAAGPSAAQAGGDRVVVRAVDATADGSVEAVVGWSGDPSALNGIEVTHDGEPVEVELGNLAGAGIRNDIALVVDTSVTTDANALLVNAKRGLTDLVGDLPAGVRAAVVAAGAAAQTRQNLSDDAGRLRDALADLAPGGEGALLAGVTRAAAMVGEGRARTVPSVVLVTDGVEDSAVSFEQARAALTEAGAALFVVALQDGAFDESSFGSLAASTGGGMQVVTEAGDLAEAIASLRPELVQLATVRFATDDGRGVRDLTVSVGDARFEGSYIAGSELIGTQRLHPRPGVEPGGIAFFRSEAGWIVGVVLAVLAVALAAWALMSLFVKDDRLGEALQPYADGYAPGSEDDHGGGSQALAQTALLQRAVAITEQFAERQGFLSRLERRLEKADLPLRAGEALFFYGAGVVAVVALAMAVSENLLGGLLVGIVVALLPPAVLSFLAGRKKRQFEALLPDTLQLLSSTLRAGYSMMQGVDAVSQEAAEPMGKELRRVMTEARLGRPLEEALDAVAERMESPDFAWAVMAIRIQREVGGNLAELLLTVAETMTERERLRRDVSALTAEGRMSAYVLLGLPVGLCMFLYSINPDYMGLLFERTVGQMALGAAVVMMVVGYLWMKKIITIEI